MEHLIFEQLPTGDYAIENLEVIETVDVSTELLSRFLQWSLDGRFYPFRFHETPIKYNANGFYKIYKGEWRAYDNQRVEGNIPPCH